MKIPGPVQNKKPSFDFEYEFISLKNDPKHYKKFLFEAMIKVKRDAQFELRKKIFPKILSFYYLLKVDAEFIYATSFNERNLHRIVSEENAPTEQNAPAAGKFNDRRDRMNPTQIKVYLKAFREIQVDDGSAVS